MTTPAGELADLTSNLADIAGVAGEAMSRAERQEARRLQKIRVAKQKIVNEVEASRRVGDYEEQIVGLDRQLRQQFADEPDKAVDEFVRQSRDLASSAVSDAPNSDIGLAVARGTAARITRGTRELHDWVSARQTQKAKTDLSVQTRRVVRGAEDRSSPEDLAAYLSTKSGELAPVFQSVFGDQARAKLNELFTDSAEAYVLASSDRDPVGTLRQLDAKSGPLVDFLDADDRTRLRRSAKQSLEGFGKQREYEIIKDGFEQNRDAHDLFMNGELTAGTVHGMRKAIRSKIASTRVSPQFSPQQREKQIELLRNRERFLDAIESVRRRQLPFDAEDEVGAVTTLLQQHEELFKHSNGKKGRDLLAWQQQQTRLVLAHKDRKISQSTYNSLMKAMALALPRALEAESKDTGWFKNWFGMRSPREAGNAELAARFKTGQFRELPSEVQARVRLSYLEQLNALVESGATIDERTARKAALKALSVETGASIPGAFD